MQGIFPSCSRFGVIKYNALLWQKTNMDLLYTILCFCIKLFLLFSYAIIVNTCKRDIITVEKEDSTCYCFLQKKIEKSYGIKPLLEGASLYLSRGDKVGVVGLNGMGKSTLLKIIAGVEQYDSRRLQKYLIWSFIICLNSLICKLEIQCCNKYFRRFRRIASNERI